MKSTADTAVAPGDGSSGASYDYLYDDLSRTTQSLFTFDSRTAQFDYEYDVASNMTVKSATLDSTLDFENTYGYDDLHRLTSFTQTGQSGGNTVADKHVTLAYNKASQRTDLLRYADDEVNASNLVIDTAYDYDDIGRLTQIDHTDGTSTIHKFDFTYDPASRIDSILSSVDGLRDYSYDDTNQLTGVEDASQTSLEDYSYDDNGNRTNTGYTTGDYNRLTSDGTYNYEYDNEGNRTRRVHSTTGATTVYQWDHRNRLTAVIDYANETDADADQNRTQTVEHQYDAFNQWIAKSVDADGDGSGSEVDEFYIHESGQIAFRLDDSGDVENRYAWDPTTVDQLWADEAIGEELRWAVTDHLGSVHDLVHNSGNVDKHIEYDSFGNVTADTAPAVDLLFGYTGRPFDDDTKLQNNLNRWHEPATGKWGSEDPISFSAGDVNLSRYVGNNVVSNTDPLGLQFAPTTGGTIGVNRNGDTVAYPSQDPNDYIPPAANPGRFSSFEEWRNADQRYRDHVLQSDSSRVSMEQLRAGLAVRDQFVANYFAWHDRQREQMDEARRRMMQQNINRNWVPEYGVCGSGLAGLAAGGMEVGQALTYPARWFGADFSRQDAALERMWRIARVSDETRDWTEFSANTGATAAYMAGGVTAWNYFVGEFALAFHSSPASPVGVHVTFGFGRGGQLVWAHGVGAEMGFATTYGAGPAGYFTTVEGIPILFPGAIGTWVSGRPDQGDCAKAAAEAWFRGMGGQ